MTDDAALRTAFEPFSDRLQALGIREVALASQVSVRVDERGATMLDFPTEPNTWSGLDGREVLWLGPDEWLLTAEVAAANEVIADLDARLEPAGHRSIVDVSANRAVLDLDGDDRRDLLASGCGLDLHPRFWRSGMCAQTLLANVAVLLRERGDATRVFVRPSFAGHLVRWFEAVTG